MFGNYEKLYQIKRLDKQITELIFHATYILIKHWSWRMLLNIYTVNIESKRISSEIHIQAHARRSPTSCHGIQNCILNVMNQTNSCGTSALYSREMNVIKIWGGRHAFKEMLKLPNTNTHKCDCTNRSLSILNKSLLILIANFNKEFNNNSLYFSCVVR